MLPRKLELVIIDDEITRMDHDGSLFQFFDLHIISGWRRAQEYLIGAPPLGIPRADLIICDVSMHKDKDLRFAKAHSTVGRPLIPVGILFALPFLHSRPIVSLMPYSHFFTHGTLDHDPIFLVTMGLVAAKTARAVHLVKGKSYSIEDTDGGDDASVSVGGRDLVATIDAMKKANVTNRSRALREVLPDYRDQLSDAIREGTVRVTNIPQIEALAKALEANSGAAGKGYMPLAEGAALELVSSFGWDRIQLRSLFADKLTPRGDKISRDAADELDTFCIQAWGADATYQMAVQAIRDQDRHAHTHDGSILRPRIDNIIRELFCDATSETKREVLRLCVLFANVHAWAVSGAEKKFRRKDVYLRLGGEVLDPHTYESWFGARVTPPKRRKRIGKAGALTARDIDFIPRFGSTVQGRDGCFLSKESWPLDDLDVDRVRNYLCEFNVAEAYADDSRDILSHCIPFPLVAR